MARCNLCVKNEGQHPVVLPSGAKGMICTECAKWIATLPKKPR